MLGLRDKTIFLAARRKVYRTTAIMFLLPGVDMIIGTKLVARNNRSYECGRSSGDSSMISRTTHGPHGAEAMLRAALQQGGDTR